MYESRNNTKPGQDKDYQFKLFVLIIITISSICILIFRIGYIQIFKNFSYAMQSRKNRERIERISPIRGKIYSNDGYLLADNIPSFNIYINPKELYKDTDLRNKELLFLSEALEVKFKDIESIINQEKSIGDEILIAENLSVFTFSKIKENLDKLSGVYYKEVLYRVYPNNDILAHELGHTGPISSSELAIKKNQGYEQNDYIGKNGIEKYYEDILRGKPGEKIFLVDAHMTILKELESKELKPEPGNELVLTINLELQKNVEDILADRAGSIIVIKPSSGEILAMASYPDYDPNIYILNTKENNNKKREIFLDTEKTPLINRNIQSLYPPASIFKLVTSTAIIKESLIPINKAFYCPGYYWIGRKNYKCWVYPGQHGWETLIDGIKYSCDVYFYNAGLIVGPKRIQQYALSYGFGSLLNIDLPSEKEGIIPSVEWMKNKGEIWQDGHTLNTVIGQGDVKVTPLQIANFMSILCNKGYSFKPHLLKEIRSSINGQTIRNIEKEKIINVQIYDQSVFDFLHEALKKVTIEGTAGRAFYSNKLKLAGKTGTAEIGTSENKQTHSWFAGFGPIDYPLEDQIVVVVLIEHENNNYLKFAAPIASMVFNSWFNKEDFETTAKRLYYPIKKTYNEKNMR